MPWIDEDTWSIRRYSLTINVFKRWLLVKHQVSQTGDSQTCSGIEDKSHLLARPTSGLVLCVGIFAQLGRSVKSRCFFASVKQPKSMRFSINTPIHGLFWYWKIQVTWMITRCNPLFFSRKPSEIICFLPQCGQIWPDSLHVDHLYTEIIAKLRGWTVLGKLLKLLLWMAEKSCTTKRMVETCWNTINNDHKQWDGWTMDGWNPIPSGKLT